MPCCRGARRWPAWAGDPGCPRGAPTAFLVPPSRALSTAPSGWQDTRRPVALLTKLKQATCVGDHSCSWGVFEKTVAARGLLGEAVECGGRTGSAPEGAGRARTIERKLCVQSRGEARWAVV